MLVNFQPHTAVANLPVQYAPEIAARLVRRTATERGEKREPADRTGEGPSTRPRTEGPAPAPGRARPFLQDPPRETRAVIAKKLFLLRVLEAHFEANEDAIAHTDGHGKAAWRRREEEGFPECHAAIARIEPHARRSAQPHVEAILATARALHLAPPDVPHNPRIRRANAFVALAVQRAVRVELRAYIARQRYALPGLAATLGPRVGALARQGETTVTAHVLPWKKPWEGVDTYFEELREQLGWLLERPSTGSRARASRR